MNDFFYILFIKEFNFEFEYYDIIWKNLKCMLYL